MVNKDLPKIKKALSGNCSRQGLFDRCLSFFSLPASRCIRSMSSISNPTMSYSKDKAA